MNYNSYINKYNAKEIVWKFFVVYLRSLKTWRLIYSKHCMYMSIESVQVKL